MGYQNLDTRWCKFRSLKNQRWISLEHQKYWFESPNTYYNNWALWHKDILAQPDNFSFLKDESKAPLNLAQEMDQKYNKIGILKPFQIILPRVANINEEIIQIDTDSLINNEAESDNWESKLTNKDYKLRREVNFKRIVRSWK